ncbi:hypothetical protein J2W39_000096 [Variovorax paradoxus]|uniref:Uncharacterized protein n=1 Tax=Variovorax paradoxus TaxID=34073 RepID=A0AAW8E7Q1_VARPD|nr:hypothetical protein [Variovorax paradoxus]MDP9968873.1 hypothetical protein [Variovorax paradoxus]
MDGSGTASVPAPERGDWTVRFKPQEQPPKNLCTLGQFDGALRDRDDHVAVRNHCDRAGSLFDSTVPRGREHPPATKAVSSMSRDGTSRVHTTQRCASRSGQEILRRDASG